MEGYSRWEHQQRVEFGQETWMQTVKTTQRHHPGPGHSFSSLNAKQEAHRHSSVTMTVWLFSCFGAVSKWAVVSFGRASEWVRGHPWSGQNRFTIILSIWLAMNDSYCPTVLFWLVHEDVQWSVLYTKGNIKKKKGDDHCSLKQQQQPERWWVKYCSLNSVLNGEKNGCST